MAIAGSEMSDGETTMMLVFMIIETA